MRQEPDDDLATALPQSLTVDLQLPAPARPEPDEGVAVLAERPSASAPTTSMPIPVAPAPVAAPPPEAPPEVPVAPGRAGRRPAPDGLWPRLVYRASLHLVNLGDSPRAAARKALETRIAAPLGEGARTVVVLSRKGGVGATTVTTLLGMALARTRADGVLALDAHPDRGTLADRVTRTPRATVQDIVLHAADLHDREALDAHVTRDATGLDVAGSDVDRMLGTPFDGEAYGVVADLVAPHYGIVLVDAGTGLVHAATRAALDRADAVLLVAGGGLDEARLASEALDWLEANGHERLAAESVVALDAFTQGTDLRLLDEIELHFRSRARVVVRVPYDRALASGRVVRDAALRPFTRASARELAAAVVDGLVARREAAG